MNLYLVLVWLIGCAAIGYGGGLISHYYGPLSVLDRWLIVGGVAFLWGMVMSRLVMAGM